MLQRLTITKFYTTFVDRNALVVQWIERKFPKLQIRVRVAVELLSSLQDDLPGRPVRILLSI